MTTAIPLTLHLLVLIGLYELAAGLAGLTGRINWSAMMDEFDRSPSLTFMTGFMVYILGGVLILVHCIWTDLLAIMVSAIGWIAAAEGLLMMVLPQPLLVLSRPLVRNQRAVSIFAILFGAALILLGLTGRADPTATMVYP
jgi:hypothetical protein